MTERVLLLHVPASLDRMHAGKVTEGFCQYVS